MHVRAYCPSARQSSRLIIRLEPPSHLVAENGRVEPVKLTLGVTGQIHEGADQIGLVPFLVLEDETMTALHEAQLSAVRLSHLISLGISFVSSIASCLNIDRISDQAQ